MKSLIVLFSYHHNNTQKIAEAMAKVLDAQIESPQETIPEELSQYDLAGFGSGIDSEKHYQILLELADKLPLVKNKRAFIFSTSGIAETAKNHSVLREKLKSKGYVIVGEFNCAGSNTNGFLRFFGGMNNGRPNAEDLRHAEEFAQNLKQNFVA